jgi:peptidoglycan hydrolase-like protein with peptidoglycan-binding domain
MYIVTHSKVNLLILGVCLLLIFGALPQVVSAQETDPLTVSGEVVTVMIGIDLISLRGAGVLERGAKGDAVVSLQRLLYEVGIYQGPRNGRFGPRTERAVRQLQLEHHIHSDGIVGARTIELIDKLLSSPVENVAISDSEVDIPELVTSGVGEGFLDLETLNTDSSLSCSVVTTTEEGMCVFDIDTGEHQCAPEIQDAISIIDASEGGMVLAADLAIIGAETLVMDLSFGEDLSGWIVNVGNSESNNGWGGDASDTKFDGEFQLYNNLASLFRNDIGVYRMRKDHLYGNTEVDRDALSQGSAHIEISDGDFAVTFFDSKGVKIASSASAEEYIFRLAHTEDVSSEGDNDAKLFIGLNRVVSGSGRVGSGVISAKVLFRDTDGSLIGTTTTEEFRCDDPQTGASLLLPLEQSADTAVNSEARVSDILSEGFIPVCSLSVIDTSELSPECTQVLSVEQASDATMMLHILAREQEPFAVSLVMDSEVLSEGWIFNLGDSPTNNGWGGDVMPDNADGEMHLYNGLLSTFNDEVSVQAGSGALVGTAVIKPEELLGRSVQLLVSPSLVAIQVVDSATGNIIREIMYEEPTFMLDGDGDGIYLGINRTIGDAKRIGSGVVSVEILAPLEAQSEL